MTIDLEELRKQKALEEILASQEQASQEVTTAFLVVQDTKGQWAAYADYQGLEINAQRQASLDDIVGGCANTIMGCQVQQTGISTVIMMEQRAQQMQQQMLQQQSANRAASLIDPSKLRSKDA